MAYLVSDSVARAADALDDLAKPLLNRRDVAARPRELVEVLRSGPVLVLLARLEDGVDLVAGKVVEDACRCLNGRDGAVNAVAELASSQKLSAHTRWVYLRLARWTPYPASCQSGSRSASR